MPKLEVSQSNFRLIVEGFGRDWRDCQKDPGETVETALGFASNTVANNKITSNHDKEAHQLCLMMRFLDAMAGAVTNADSPQA